MEPHLDQARNTAWRAFLASYITVVEQIEQELAEADLPSLSWYDVLFALSEAPEHQLRLHELAQAVLLSRCNVTRLVDRLEAAGLLCRKRCPIDRRGAFAVLTPEGTAMLQKMWPVYAQGIEKYFGSHLRDDEVKVLTKVLQRLLAATNEPTA